jgi:hypothetical protein
MQLSPVHVTSLQQIMCKKQTCWAATDNDNICRCHLGAHNDNDIPLPAGQSYFCVQVQQLLEVGERLPISGGLGAGVEAAGQTVFWTSPAQGLAARITQVLTESAGETDVDGKRR